MIALMLGIALAATPPRYGGELRLLAPSSALGADGSNARSPLELALARTHCEPLYRIADGGLEPDVAQLPRSEGPRQFALELRPSDATRAADLISALARASAPGSPYRALGLPLTGEPSPRSDAELTVALAFPYPDWPLALAHAGICAAPGPFEGKLSRAASRLAEHPGCAAGRPFADSLLVGGATPRSAARALASKGADLALMSLPEPAQESVGPLAVATYLAVNPRKPQLAPVAALVAQKLDRAELVRIFVRGPAQPLYGLLAPSVEPHPVSTPIASLAALPAHLQGTLLVDASLDTRAVADRIQVRLHDFGADLRVLALPRAELERRLASGDYDAALVSLPALPEAGLNLAQVLLLAEPADAVRSELAAIGALGTPEARRDRASARARELLGKIPVVPLYAQGLAVSVRAGVHGLGFDAAGVPDLGAIWFEEAR